MILRFYRVLQHLSIDIVFGAVILLHFFSQIYEVTVGWPSYVLLGSAIWMVYTLDHLRDAQVARIGNRERYRFHEQYKRALKVCLFLALSFTGFCLLYVERNILIGGLAIVLFSISYIFFQSKLAKLGLKELYIAIVYTLGVLIAPISVSLKFDLYLFSSLLILAFLNLIIFSWFECEEDGADTFYSIAILKGKEKLTKLILVVISIGFALGVVSFDEFSMFSVYLIVALLAFLLLMMYPEWVKKNERYRAVGDAVFLLPILFELL